MRGLAILGLLAAAVNSLIGIALLWQVAENPDMPERRARLTARFGMVCIGVACLLLFVIGMVAVAGAV